MILRRLSQSLKEQNWTTIVIEFVLLVCGVFSGIRRQLERSTIDPYRCLRRLRASPLALDVPDRGNETAPMTSSVPARRPSASAPGTPQRVPKSARERVLRALELGRRGQLLRRLGEHARSGDVARAG